MPSLLFLADQLNSQRMIQLFVSPENFFFFFFFRAQAVTMLQARCGKANPHSGGAAKADSRFSLLKVLLFLIFSFNK